MSVHARSQILAQAAFRQISKAGKPDKEYASFAKKFPALIHTCGLAQAVAFAQAKGKSKEDGPEETKPELRYLEHLAAVMRSSGHTEIQSADKLADATREVEFSQYLRLSRDAIDAAAWLKRYVEAARGDD